MDKMDWAKRTFAVWLGRTCAVVAFASGVLVFDM